MPDCFRVCSGPQLQQLQMIWNSPRCTAMYCTLVHFKLTRLFQPLTISPREVERGYCCPPSWLLTVPYLPPAMPAMASVCSHKHRCSRTTVALRMASSPVRKALSGSLCLYMMVTVMQMHIKEQTRENLQEHSKLAQMYQPLSEVMQITRIRAGSA